MPIALDARRIIRCDDVNRFEPLRKLHTDLALSSDWVVRLSDLVLAPRAMLEKIHVSELGIVRHVTVFGARPSPSAALAEFCDVGEPGVAQTELPDRFQKPRLASEVPLQPQRLSPPRPLSAASGCWPADFESRRRVTL